MSDDRSSSGTDGNEGGGTDEFERTDAGGKKNKRATDEPTDTPTGDEESDRKEDLEQWAERLDQRELGLDKRAEDLEERAARLDDREEDLRERSAELEEYREELEAREERIAEREDELDEREARIEKQEEALAERADELDRTERTLQNYVGDQVVEIEEEIGDTIQEAVSSAIVHSREEDGSRFGTTGTLLLGLSGVVLIAAGTANAAAGAAGGSAVLLTDTAANLGVGAVAVLIGLFVNLVAVTNRV